MSFSEPEDGIPGESFKEFAEMRGILKPQFIANFLDAFTGKKRHALGFKDQAVQDILLGRLMNG